MSQYECSNNTCDNKNATKKCVVCKFSYCSTSCQREDWPNHKITCSSHKYDRIRKFVDYLRQKHYELDSLDYDIWVSTAIYSKYHGNIKAFNVSNTQNYVCVICECSIKYTGPMKELKFVLKDRESPMNISCHRCHLCNKKDLKLFPVNFMTLNELRFYFLLCTRQYKLPPDMRKYICFLIHYD